MGRHPECDIVLDAGAVSRQHAQITWIDGDFFVEDLHSRNGTFVNGTQIQGPTSPLRRRSTEDLRSRVHILPRPAQPAGHRSALPGMETVLGGAMLVDDEADNTVGRSTIMSKIDISSDAGGVRLGVNPEMKLRAWLEITQNLRKSLNVDEVLPKLLDSLFKIFLQADRGFVVLRGSGRRAIGAQSRKATPPRRR